MSVVAKISCFVIKAVWKLDTSNTITGSYNEQQIIS